jgi:hypothetical protein
VHFLAPVLANLLFVVVSELSAPGCGAVSLVVGEGIREGRGSVLKQKNWNCRFADSGTSTCSNLKASNRPQLTGK